MHHRPRTPWQTGGWTECAPQWRQEHLIPLGGTLNRENTKIVDTLKDEALGLLGFELRGERKWQKARYYGYMSPQK